MAKTYVFCNQKGGVGKTTTTVNIAAVLAQRGIRTLLVDFDPQGNSTSGLGISKKELTVSIYDLLSDEASFEQTTQKTTLDNLHILPSRTDLAGAEIELVSAVGREFILKNKLSEVSDKYDVILIDCPPSLGLMTINALTAADRLIIPLQCEYYALEGLGELLKTFQLVHDKLNRNLAIAGVVLTMADFRNNLTNQVIEEVRKFFQNQVFKTIIPRSVRLSEAPSHGQAAVTHDPSSKGAKAYVALTEEFMEREKIIASPSSIIPDTAVPIQEGSSS
jgi:chromosome partitioning protein